MKGLSVGAAIKDAAELWSQRWLKLLPVGVLAHTFAFVVSLGLVRLLELHPLVAFEGGLSDSAPLGEFFRRSGVWLIGPLGAAIVGGGMVFLLWAAWCLVALDHVGGLAALTGVLPRAGLLLRRFLVGALASAALVVAPVAAAAALGGTLGQVVLVAGLLLAAWICWPRWVLLAPLTLKETGGFFRRYRALAPPPIRRTLFLLGLASFALALVMTVPAALALSFDTNPLLVGSVLIPFHALIAPLQAFIQARAYAQLTAAHALAALSQPG